MSNVPGALVLLCDVEGCQRAGEVLRVRDELAGVMAVGAHLQRHLTGDQMPRISAAPSWRELVTGEA